MPKQRSHLATADQRRLLTPTETPRLAHRIGRAAQAQGIDANQLRSWLTTLHLDAWRSEFAATPFETTELLEYVRKRRPSMIGRLLEDGNISLEVTTSSEVPANSVPVQLRFTEGPAPAALILASGENTLAVIPADVYPDVTSVIDSGIDTDATLIGNLLTLRLPTSD